MTQAAETPADRLADPDAVREQLAGKHVCPFCGALRADAQQPCPRCTMEDSPTTRTATRQRIGPWFVLQSRNPSAPGMRFQTLLSLVRKGHVTPRSVLRGPTTHQLWSFAARVKGLSREFGLCYHCGTAIDFKATACPRCERPQEPPAFPDTLLETSDPTRAEAQRAAEPVRAEVTPLNPTPRVEPEQKVPAAKPDVVTAAPVTVATDFADSSTPTVDPAPGKPRAKDPNHLVEDAASLVALTGNALTGGTAPKVKRTPPAPVVIVAPAAAVVPQPAAVVRPAPPPQAAPVQSAAAATPQPAPASSPFKVSSDPLTTDSGMDGGTSLDLQIDPFRPAALPARRPAAAALRPAPPPGMMKQEDAILSAKELATAFQLDFRPDGKVPRRFRPFVAFFALLLIAAIGAGILFFLRPDYRLRATDWATGAWTNGKARFASPAPAGPATAPPPATRGSAAVAPERTPDVRPAPPAPDTKPAEVRLTPAPVIPVPVDAPVLPSAVTVDPAVAVAQAQSLRREAIDAEFRREYPAALKLYQQIERLPRDAWPPDLQVRMEEVRKRVK